CEESDKDPQDQREPGQALWPSRFNEKALEETRDTSGPRDWASIHQQRPRPSDGVVFKQQHSRHFSENFTSDGLQFPPPSGDGAITPRQYFASACRWFQCCDTALTVAKSSAYTCVGTFALTPGHDLLVYHIWRERLEVPEQFNALMQLREGAAVFNRQARSW